MKRFLAMLALLVLSVAAFALPSVEAVQNEVQQGHYAQAESMMREVVAAKPGSARAHYIYAEILAHNRRFDEAALEARLARQLDPKMGFTQPDKFRAFEQLVEREQNAAKPLSVTPPATRATAPAAVAPAQRSSGLPGWVWGVGFAVVAALVWRLVSARQRAATLTPGMTAPGYGAPAGGYGPGYGPASPGSGMLGTGLPAAGGFPAGTLAAKLPDGGRQAPDPGGA